eukprot:1610428-Pleurochrysis_carterae.AAC.1
MATPRASADASNARPTDMSVLVATCNEPAARTTARVTQEAGHKCGCASARGCVRKRASCEESCNHT